MRPSSHGQHLLTPGARSGLEGAALPSDYPGEPDTQSFSRRVIDRIVIPMMHERNCRTRNSDDPCRQPKPTLTFA
jgi:hypothetical protein